MTDDARVVGKGHVQIETWWRRDHQTFEHWLLPAVGPTDWLELTLGGTQGTTRTDPHGARYALGGPLLQSKLLLRESKPNRPPGAALATGTIMPFGFGGLEAPGWGGFGYLAVTQSFVDEDDLVFHANVGLAAIRADGVPPVRLTWGLGTQVETFGGVHVIGELFSGDPYTPGSGGAYQAGFRFIFNDHLQLDGTFGGGLWGETVMPLWFSSGVRVVSHELF